jgi:hypothetical protein
MTKREQRCQAIQATLAKVAASPGTARGAAEAALGLWGQVVDQLVPVIGHQGVDALLGRARHLAGLTELQGQPGGPPVPLATLHGCLELSYEANEALLVTFTDLLAGLIGESLTSQMLGPVWTSPAPPSDQESAS